MARSVNFTLNEISDFISGVGGINEKMEHSLQSVREAVSNTVTRLSNAAAEYRKQLYDIEADANLAYNVRFDVESAKKSAQGEMERANDAYAKMSEEEQRANQSAVEGARKRYDAMCRAYETIDRIYKGLTERANQVRRTADQYEAYAHTLENQLRKFEQAAYSHIRIISGIKSAAEGARRAGEMAIEALCGSTGDAYGMRLRITNVEALSTLASAVEDFTEMGKEGLDTLSRSAKQAEFLMESAVMSAAGTKVSELEHSLGEANRGLVEYGKRAETAYSALDSYLRYGSITIY